MNRSNIKSIAIAKLKNGEEPENIGSELGISESLVQEWADSLSPKELIDKEVNVIAVEKAKQIIQSEPITNIEQLQNTLINLSLAITDEIQVGFHDHEIAKSLNTAADTIAKLQNSIFAKGTQIAVIGNNSNISSKELRAFEGLLRD